MQNITEYLSTKVKVKRMPTPDADIDEIAEWIKLFGVEYQDNMGYIPKNGNIGYCMNTTGDVPEHYWIALRNCNKDQIQNIVVMPKAQSFASFGKETLHQYHKELTIDRALELMEQVMEKPTIKLYKTKI
jgi:hypothetical protein